MHTKQNSICNKKNKNSKKMVSNMLYDYKLVAWIPPKVYLDDVISKA